MFDRYPYTNFHELNLEYFIKHFKEIFDEWNELYETLTSWKDTTDAELETWKTGVENNISAWETSLLADLETWKAQTGTDIDAWETATIAALDAWKTAAETAFEVIRVQAAASATEAGNYATAANTAKTAAETAQAAAEAAAASVSASATQITTNTTDISAIKAALIVGNNDNDLLNTVATNSDFNSVGIGTHTVINNATASTISNIPETVAGKLFVVSITATARISQIYYTITNNIYYRYYDGNNWYQWKKVSNVVVDNTLTQSGQAADSATVGTHLAAIESEILPLDKSLIRDDSTANARTVTEKSANYTVIKDKFVNSNMAMSGQIGSNGITWSRSEASSNEVTMTGTNNSASDTNLNTWGATSSRPYITGKGENECLKITYHTTGDGTNSWLNARVVSTSLGTKNYKLYFDSEVQYIYLPADTTSMLFRYQVAGSAAIGTITMSFDVEMVVPHWVPSTNTNDNRYDAIRRRLTLCHRVMLGVGDYYYNTTLALETGDIIEGVSGSRLIYTGSGNAITANYNTKITNIQLAGDASAIEIGSTEGTKHGIYLSGENANADIGVVIDGCLITDFNGSAIKANSTGYPTRGHKIINCQIKRCWAGVNLFDNTEYWKVVNTIATGCYYGLIDNGGNNMIANCGFDSNEIGMWIDNVDGTHSNNTHGSITNCSLNHNTTLALKATGSSDNILQSGMVFNGCQFWYGGISLTYGYGFAFVGCNFGNTVPITLDHVQSIIFSACLFRTLDDSPVTITNSADKIIKFFNCYTRYGTVVPETPT